MAEQRLQKVLAAAGVDVITAVVDLFVLYADEDSMRNDW